MNKLIKLCILDPGFSRYFFGWFPGKYYRDLTLNDIVRMNAPLTNGKKKILKVQLKNISNKIIKKAIKKNRWDVLKLATEICRVKVFMCILEEKRYDIIYWLCRNLVIFFSRHLNPIQSILLIVAYGSEIINKVDRAVDYYNFMDRLHEFGFLDCYPERIYNPEKNNFKIVYQKIGIKSNPNHIPYRDMFGRRIREKREDKINSNNKIFITDTWNVRKEFYCY